MDVLLRRLVRAAVRRGLAGDWVWLVIAACAFVLRRALNDEGDVVSSLRVARGERILISVREWDARRSKVRVVAAVGVDARPAARARAVMPEASALRTRMPLTTTPRTEASASSKTASHALEAGERILLIDPKERRYLITLVAGATFHTHAGVIAHDDIIGGDEGRTITGSTGRHFLVLRPTLSDIVLKMPRGAQVIYPKDLGAILIAADLGPGQRVLEAGVGSGALSMTVLRAGASVVGYELREDFAARATSNVIATLGPDAPYRVEIRDVTEGIDERDLDRILLDMPEPHKVIPAAAQALRPGGILLAYLPTINQTALLRQALDDESAPFGLPETQEIMRRTWHIEARSVRPDHRMVGHTGFLTTARRLSV